MEKVAGLVILTNNREESSIEINRILSKNAKLIMSRMGVNVQKSCTSHCPGLIMLAVKADNDSINNLYNELKSLNNLKVELSSFSEDDFLSLK